MSGLGVPSHEVDDVAQDVYLEFYKNQEKIPEGVAPGSRFVLASDMEAIEIAFDAAKYGESPELPVIEFTLPSVNDPTLAPDEKHLLSANEGASPSTRGEGIRYLLGLVKGKLQLV